MAIIEKVTREDLELYEILRNPALAIEFIQNFDKLDWEEDFELTWYQKEFILDFSSYVSIMAARATGKTVSLSGLLIWVLVFNVYPSDYVVYSVPSKVHLEPVWTNLVRSFRSNSFLKAFMDARQGINGSDFTVKLKNGMSLLCRIAGQSGTGANVIGLHTPFFILDESGYYPWGTFVELQPTINTFTSGFKLAVAGVPTGLREKNVCFHCDMENSNYSKHRINAYLNPRFTESDKQRSIEQYGGEDSEDYIHLVMAEHGKPSFAIFDRGLFSIGNDTIYKMDINGTELQEDLSAYESKISLFPNAIDSKNKVIMGIDLGYTEPTAILILYLERGILHFYGKFNLVKVPYPIQEKLIDRLDSKFNPIILGIDRGGTGVSTVQHLIGDTDYLHKNYNKRLVPIDFSASITLGIDQDGQEIKTKTKPFAVSVLQDYCNNHKLVFSNKDLDMITELERMTYSKTPSGDIVYKTLTARGGKRGDDHYTSALLCGVLAFYLENEFILSRQTQRKLYNPTWII